MIKKITLWALFAGVVGLLVFGAVNRTSAKAGGEDPRGNARVEEENTEQHSRRGFGNSDPERQEADDLHLAENEDHEWVNLSGFVAALDEGSLLIEVDAENPLVVSGRAWRFIQEEQFKISIGDQVTLKGFYENEEFEVSEINDLTSGEVLPIRDEYGTPLWSGRGH